MVGFADFEPDARAERGGNAEARAENADDERVAGLDDFDLPPDANAERLKPLDFFAAGLDAADNRARSRRKLVQPRFEEKFGRRRHHTMTLGDEGFLANPILPSAGQFLLCSVGAARRFRAAGSTLQPNGVVSRILKKINFGAENYFTQYAVL